MPVVTRCIEIRAPVERVFDFVTDYRNALQFMHNFTEFRPLGQPTCGLGAKVEAAGRMLGIPIRTRMEIVEYIPNERFVSRSYSGVDSMAAWSFEPASNGTRVCFESDFRLPKAALLVSGIAERAVTQNTEQTLRNLKRAVEAKESHDESRGGSSS